MCVLENIYLRLPVANMCFHFHFPSTYSKRQWI